MFPASILYDKNFLVSDIQIEILQNSEWTANPDYDEQVMLAWENKEHLAKEAGVTIWDGMCYRVTNAPSINSAGKILLRLGTIPYRYLATAMNLRDLFYENKLEPLFHLSTAAIIRTSDGKYVFGKRSLNGSMDLIGGGAQPNELEIRSGIDLESNLLKEMREETGILESHIESVQGIGIIQSITSNVLVISLAQLNLSENEANEVFKDRLENEMSDLIFVTEKEIKPFLRGMAIYRPLIADLL